MQFFTDDPKEALQTLKTVHLSVAMSMTDVFNEMITGFSAKHTDANSNRTSLLQAAWPNRSSKGPADIFLSANPKWMKYLVEK